jgi:hypothetical protein
VAPQQVELLTGGYHERVSCRCLFSK